MALLLHNCLAQLAHGICLYLYNVTTTGASCVLIQAGIGTRENRRISIHVAYADVSSLNGGKSS